MRRLALVLALAALVSCSDDADVGTEERPQPTVPGPDVDGPRLGDHWHLAVGFSRCGEELPVLEDTRPDETGIHSHGDGLIHVHPFVDEVTGEGAVLARFFETVGAEVTREGLVTPEWELPFEGECDGEPARLTLVRWPRAEMEIRTEVGAPFQLDDLALGPDGAAIAIALATPDQEIPRPPSTEELAAPSDVPAEPTDVDFGLAPVLGTAPCDDTTTPVADGPQCYELGPVAVDRDAIASAEAQYTNEWTVLVRLTTAGDRAVDAVAEACFNRTAACPSGLLAVVLDGTVVSAPIVRAPSLGRELMIVAAFDEAEATRVADALTRRT